MGTKSIVPRVDNEGGIGENTTPKYWKEAYLYDAYFKNSPWVDVRTYASFSEAIDGIGATEKNLLIPNQQNVTGDKTVPSNVTLKFTQGGTLNISNTKTVTINGHVEAGLYQIFEGDGFIKFGTGAVESIHPEWFDDGDSATDGINEAIESITTNGIIDLVNKTYSITGSGYLNILGTLGQVWLRGVGQGISIIHNTGDGTTISQQDGVGLKISDMSILGNDDTTSYGIIVRDGFFFRDLHLGGFTGVALQVNGLNGVIYSSWIGGQIYNTYGKGIWLHPLDGCINANLFKKIRIQGEIATADDGIWIEKETGDSSSIPAANIFEDITIEKCKVGIDIDTGFQNEFIRIYLEGHDDNGITVAADATKTRLWDTFQSTNGASDISDSGVGTIINGVGAETADAETPTAANWLTGDIVDFIDSGDASGNGVYLKLKDDSWCKIGT